MTLWMLFLSAVVNACLLCCRRVVCLARQGPKKRKVAFSDPLATVRTYSDSIGSSSGGVAPAGPSSGSSACARIIAKVYGPDGARLSIVTVHAVCELSRAH